MSRGQGRAESQTTGASAHLLPLGHIGDDTQVRSARRHLLHRGQIVLVTRRRHASVHLLDSGKMMLDTQLPPAAVDPLVRTIEQASPRVGPSGRPSDQSQRSRDIQTETALVTSCTEANDSPKPIPRAPRCTHSSAAIATAMPMIGPPLATLLPRPIARAQPILPPAAGRPA